VPSGTPLTYQAPQGQGPNNIALLQDGSTIEVLNNSTIVAEAPRAETTAIDIIGAQNEVNTLTLDYGPINNPDNLPVAPTRIPISFDGGSPGGTLILKGGNFTNEEDFANDPHSGTLYLDSSPIVYTNLAPIIDTATATNLTIVDPEANDPVTIQNDPNSPENGVPTSQISGSGFEKVDLANKITVIFVDTSRPGHDTFNILDPLVNGATFTVHQMAWITNGPATSTATVGTAYSFAYTAQGTPAPTFSLLSGSQLPPGLTLSTSGVISGTPTATGTFTGTVSADNGVLLGDTQPYSITVGQAQPILHATAGPTVVLGTGAKLTASATLDSGFNENGTLTFQLHAPNGATVDSETDSVNGDGTYQTPHGYLPLVKGTYQWVVSYSGDAGNNSVSGGTNEVAVGPGITVLDNFVGTIRYFLYLVGGNTSDQVSVAPAGTSPTGSTGIKVNALLNNVSYKNLTTTHRFTEIFVFGFGGNDVIGFAKTLTIPTVISEGNGNDTLVLGNGNYSVTLGSGNNRVTAGTGNVTIQATGGTNTVTAGAVGSTGTIRVQLGDGINDHVNLLGNGNDTVQVGNGNNDSVSITGQGNDQVVVGNGTNDSVTIVGNGNETVQTGTGTGTLDISGTGQNTLQLGPGWMITGRASTTTITGPNSTSSTTTLAVSSLSYNASTGVVTATVTGGTLTSNIITIAGVTTPANAFNGVFDVNITSSTTFTYTVATGLAAPSQTGITATVFTPTAITIGQAFNLTASVVGVTGFTPTGTVVFVAESNNRDAVAGSGPFFTPFTIGTGTLVNGIAVLSVPATGANSIVSLDQAANDGDGADIYELEAFYSGDASYAAGNSTAITPHGGPVAAGAGELAVSDTGVGFYNSLDVLFPPIVNTSASGHGVTVAGRIRPADEANQGPPAAGNLTNEPSTGGVGGHFKIYLDGKQFTTKANFTGNPSTPQIISESGTFQVIKTGIVTPGQHVIVMDYLGDGLDGFLPPGSITITFTEASIGAAKNNSLASTKGSVVFSTAPKSTAGSTTSSSSTSSETKPSSSNGLSILGVDQLFSSTSGTTHHTPRTLAGALGNAPSGDDWLTGGF
jgi:hypothetical protein